MTSNPSTVKEKYFSSNSKLRKKQAFFCLSDDKNGKDKKGFICQATNIHAAAATSKLPGNTRRNSSGRHDGFCSGQVKEKEGRLKYRKLSYLRHFDCFRYALAHRISDFYGTIQHRCSLFHTKSTRNSILYSQNTLLHIIT